MKEKKVFVIKKLYDSVDNTNGFRISLTHCIYLTTSLTSESLSYCAILLKNDLFNDEYREDSKLFYFALEKTEDTMLHQKV